MTGVVPDGCVGGDLDHSFFLAIPLLDGEAFPMSLLVSCEGFQSRQALAFLAWTPPRSGSYLGGLIQGSIQAQASDHADWILKLAQLPKQVNHGKTAVCDHDQKPFGQPATNLQDHLLCPLSQLLMPASLAFVI